MRFAMPLTVTVTSTVTPTLTQAREHAAGVRSWGTPTVHKCEPTRDYRCWDAQTEQGRDSRARTPHGLRLAWHRESGRGGSQEL